MEDSPLFNAGNGAVFNAAGNHEMDASIMEGAGLNAGAVASVSHIKNPIDLASRVMTDSEHVMLMGDGAEEFARQQGFEMMDPAISTPISAGSNCSVSRPGNRPKGTSKTSGFPPWVQWPSTGRATWQPALQPAAPPISVGAAWVTRPLLAPEPMPAIAAVLSAQPDMVSFYPPRGGL